MLHTDSRPVRPMGALARRRSAWLLGSAAIACLIAAPALAQTKAADGKETAVEEVVVTGTSIRGEQPTGSDLIAVGRDDIIAIGAPTTADLLKKVPELNSFNSVVRTGLSASTGTGSAPGLRNLNANATLVLMDGQRLVAENPLQTVPDPSSIPPAAIERIEIVADGASAIYGSDAVAGVINIILRKNLDGAETSIRKGWGQHGYDAIDLSQALGKVWSTGSAMIVVGYSENSHLANYDIPYYTEDLRPFGGTDLRPTNCSPPNLVLSGTTYAPPGYAAGAAARCTPGLLGDNVPAFDRLGVVGNARQQLTDNLSVFADLKYTSTHAKHMSAPGGTNVTLTTANPFFFRPAGAVGNSETVVYNLFPNVGVLANRAFAHSLDVIVGADYSLPHDFRLQGTINYGHGENEAHQPGFDSAALNAAAAGTTTATALDPFGGRTSAAVNAAIGNFENFFSSDQKLYDYQLKADGPLFSLPGGQVKVAVGLDYRKYQYDAVNTVGNIGANQGLGQASAERTVKAIFGEVLVPLVGADNAVPFVRTLNFSAAVRRDDYSDFGETTNPKYGVTWQPIEGLTIRGSYGKSFHAPDMGDSYAVDTRALYFVNFPIVPPGSPPVDTIALAGGNPGLQPEKATTYSIGAEFNPTWLPGFRASVTYWNIEYSGLIRTAPISPEVFTNPAFASFAILNPTQAQIDEIARTFRVVQTTLPIPPGVKQIIDLRRHNLGATNTDGFDYDFSYRWDTDMGAIAAGFSGSRIMTFELSSATNAPFIPQNNFIKTRWRAEVSWLKGPASAGAAWNHSGQYDQTYNRAAGGTAVQRVDAFDTLDLHAAYDLSGLPWIGGTTVSVNIDNALDKDPPIAYVGGGFAGSASPLGRLVWVGLNKKW
jgi:iron complex outermembrane receptor protein